MAKAAGGISLLYGVVIGDALKDPKTTLQQLTALRTRGRSQLKQHGDLAGALKKLEAEIGRRGKK